MSLPTVMRFRRLECRSRLMSTVPRDTYAATLVAGQDALRAEDQGREQYGLDYT